jgi:uncharacterized hydrophobic protein (TIGR00341 family)
MPKKIPTKQHAYWVDHKTLAEVYESLASFARPSRDNFILASLSTVICSIGLLLGNSTVVIGAILIGPLMGPILGLSFSLITQKKFLIKRFAGVLLWTLALVFGISALFGYGLSFLGFTPEMIDRTQPNILHVLLALAAGFLGGYGRIRHNIIDRAFGVAMSVSLLPPLCVIGITFAHGRLDLALGALLLFGSNLASILCGSMAAFALLDLKRFHLRTLKELVLPGIILFVLSIPLFFAFQELSTERQVAHELSYILYRSAGQFPAFEVTDIKVTSQANPLALDITVQAPQNSLQQNHASLLKHLLEKKLHRSVELTLYIHSVPIEEIRAASSP